MRLFLLSATMLITAIFLSGCASTGRYQFSGMVAPKDGQRDPTIYVLDTKTGQIWIWTTNGGSHADTWHTFRVGSNGSAPLYQR